MLIEKILIEGKSRISKIPDRISVYDKENNLRIIQEREIEESNIIDGNWLNKSYAREYLISYLNKKKIKKLEFVNGSVSINAFGSTDNNKKEFEWFEKIAAKGSLNLFLYNAALFKHCEEHEFSLLNEEIQSVLTAYDKIVNVEKPLAIVTFNSYLIFIDAFFSCLYGIRSIKFKNMPFVVVANDHSPQPVAFSMVAKLYKIPRIYLQHAEVSNYFPELDFDISILRNENSVNIYNKIGISKKNKVFVLSRFDRAFNKEKLSRFPGTIANVCIYLTGNTIIDKVLVLINKLKSNGNVNQVYIKPHPRTPQKEIAKIKKIGINVCYDWHSIEHIAICLNTSMVTELLHAGIKTYQIFGYDRSVDDYYGFVEKGIVREIDEEGLTTQFWRGALINQNWLDAYSKFNPSVKFSNSESIKELINELENMISDAEVKSAIKEIPTIRELSEKYVFYENAPFACKFIIYQLLLNEHTALRAVYKLSERDTQLITIKVIEKFYEYRAPEYITIINNIKNCKSTTELCAWLKLKSVEWIYSSLSDSDVYRVTSILDNPSLHPVIGVKIKKLLIKNLLSLNSYYWLRCLIDNEVVKINDLDANLIAQLSRLSINNNKLNKSINQKLNDKDTSSIDILKLKLLGSKLNESSIVSHAQAIVFFQSMIPQEYSDDYEKYVFPKYKSAKKSMAYMDLQWNNKEKERLLSIIEEKIANRVPFSFVRLSDGEGYLFQKDADFFDSKAVVNREYHWWGKELDKFLREKVIKLNSRVMNEVDLLGIPSIYRFARDISNTKRGLLLTGGGVTGKGLLEVLKHVSRNQKSCLLTEEKANFLLFEDVAVLKRFSSLAKRVVFVTSLKKESIQGLLNIEDVVVVNIPSHFRTYGHPDYICSKNILPYVLEDKIVELENIIKPGDLVFVSAGVAGKVFISIAKQSGAIGIDLGHAIDFLNHRKNCQFLSQASDKNKSLDISAFEKDVKISNLYLDLEDLRITSYRFYKNKEKEDIDLGLLDKFNNFFRLRHYKRAYSLIKNMHVFNLDSSFIFKITRCCFYSSNTLEATKIIEYLIVLSLNNHLPFSWYDEIISQINFCSLSYKEKKERLKSIGDSLSLSGGPKRLLNRVNSSLFNLDVEYNIICNPFAYFDYNSEDFNSLMNRTLYFSALRNLGEIDFIEVTLLKLYAIAKFNNKDVFKLFLQYWPDWVSDNVKYEDIPYGVRCNLKVLPALNPLKGSSAFFEKMYAENLSFQISRYKVADKYLRDTLLRAIIKAGGIIDASLLLEQFGFSADMHSALVVKGFEFFECDRFYDARDCFLKVVNEDPSDLLAFNGLRFCLPRTNSSMDETLEHRKLIGYGYIGNNRSGESLIYSDKVSALLNTGRYIEGFYSKRKAIHWMILKEAYPEKFLKYEIFPPNNLVSNKSVFVISDEGVGDEVRTAQFYEALERIFTEVFITCDPRLYDMLRIAYPSIHFIPVQRLRSGIRKHIKGDALRYLTTNTHISNYLTEECREFIEGSDYVTFGQNLFFNYFAARIEKTQQKSYLKTIGKKPSRFNATKSLRVGFLWRSAFKTTLRNYMYLGVEELMPLTKVKGVEFWSFQHCIDEDEIKVCKNNGVNLIEDVDLFSDFNGLSDYLSQMDYVIGVSSLPIELAAALGVEVWMLGFSPENYFLRTKGGETNIDQLTHNSKIIAPNWIDFSAPRSECVELVVEHAKRLLESKVEAVKSQPE